MNGHHRRYPALPWTDLLGSLGLALLGGVVLWGTLAVFGH